MIDSKFEAQNLKNKIILSRNCSF